ncbi:tRNA (uracil(54)-C(5))-methyltransferase homolog isoform X6 [Papio anubis]|uniref:tRNA (uracil(54)-C(5))-methyltransferase homolog isoform X6 n=1 Tax=Papio anubis TaxID=9555 RepID=UPI000B7B4FE8|nr:tRNA (uracil(54)-C(5))-methyltransferase homolog isoform X6 [Papio anubis]XP_031517543.1 tRNA (uracil(54)-C(5))-methyltransferase homolog isoform X6 [Papio anubis]
MAGLKRRVPMHSLRYFISMVGLFSKSGLLPWYARNPPGWSQLFLGTVCKGDFTHVIATKCQKGQKSQKKPSHLGPLDGSWQERLADVVTPLWRLSYEEQLKPVINGYRNKSTFSVNRGPDGNPKTVGYYLGTWRDGNIVCVRSNNLKNIPEKHSQVAQGMDYWWWHGWIEAGRPIEGSCAAVIQYYEVFLRQSPLEPCLVFHEGGYWRELIVRTNSQGHTMAIITFHPQKLSQEELHVQKETVKEFFIRGPGAACDLTSLYFQESTMTRCSHQQSPYQLLFGEPYIFEELLSLKIRISPDAFFQINTAGAEMLYRTVGELTGVNSDTILLDICCGTGVIGLSLAQHTSQVLGIELVEQAVEDARWTAAFNGITNSEFHTGRAEKILPGLLKSKEDGQSVVAVVNPARAGLHYKVIQAIRNCRAIRTLVFVSCKLHGESTRNVIELCCPPDPAKKLLGEPFVLQQAVPVDLFPHTPHCELVLLFTR